MAQEFIMPGKIISGSGALEQAQGYFNRLGNRALIVTDKAMVQLKNLDKGYEPESGRNKLFKTARIGSVEVQAEQWQFESEHHEGYIDIFRISGYNQHNVKLELNVRAHNLLIEEYPLASRDITQIDDAHWLLDTMVCDYMGVGRFVLGLLNDIKIISPDFKEHIKNDIARIHSTFNSEI